MVRRLALVPLAVLGFATAILVGGAGGAVVSVELVAVGAGGVEANGTSGGASVSGDGRYVAFHSGATNLPGVDGNGTGLDVFVRDRLTATTERITGASGASSFPSISDDGRFVAFQTARVAPLSGSDVFVFDRDTDSLEQIAPTANGTSSDVAISGDGNFVVFVSTATNITVGGSDSAPDVYRWTRADGTIEKMSVNSDEFPGAGGSSVEPAISDDGNLVVFASEAQNLVPFPGDLNSESDIFLRDVAAGTTEPVSVDASGNLPPTSFFTFGASQPAISGDGRYVAFDSWSSGLTGATSGLQVYVRDRTLGTTTRISVGNGQSGGLGPVAIGDGPHVFFESSSQLVAGGDTAFRRNIYRYAIAGGTLARVSLTSACENGTSASSSNGARNVAVSADGATAAFENSFTNLPGATHPSVVAVRLDGSTCTPTGDSDSSPPTTSTGSTSTGTTTTGTTSTTTTTTTTSTTTSESTPSAAHAGAPRLVVEPSFTLPADSAGFRPEETRVMTVTVRNVGDAPANAVVLTSELAVYTNVAGKEEGASQAYTIETSGCSSESTRADGGFATIVCGLDGLAPGAARTVRIVVRPGPGRGSIDAGFQASSAETKSDVEKIRLPEGPTKQEPCVEETSCSTSAGSDDRECVKSRCFFEEGADRGVCAGEEAVCSGGPDEDTIICLRDATCSGGADDDLDICRSGSTCTEDASDDELDCAGAETFCNAGNGVNTIDCKADAVCRDGRGDSELECRNAKVHAGRGDHEVDATNCELSFRDGDNVVRGARSNFVELEGAGSFRFRGGGRILIDAINGARNVVTCDRQEGSTVLVDKRDVVRGCAQVRGADVFVGTVRLESHSNGFFVEGRREYEGVAEVGNAGPADATNVRVRLVLAARGLDVGALSSRLTTETTDETELCSTRVAETADGEQLVIECVIPRIPAGETFEVQFVAEQVGGAARARLSANARGDEPDHAPANNQASYSEGAGEQVGGAPRAD